MLDALETFQTLTVGSRWRHDYIRSYT